MAKNKSSAARYSIAGLVIAGIGGLGLAALAIVRGSMALGLYTPAQPESVTGAMAIAGSVILVGLGLYAILNPLSVRRFFTGRQARHGSNALVLSLAFLGILVVVNWIVYQNPKRFDFTEGKQHTLAPETLQALATLPESIKAKAFYSSQYPTDSAKALLGDLRANSAGKFEFEFVDPYADPVQAREYGVTGDGKIVLIMGDRQEMASFADENSLMQAMIRLISPETRVVYFLTGHGEPGLQTSDATSLQRARETLESKNYTVDTLNLGATNSVPEDAEVVVIAGANDPLLAQEVSLIQQYMDAGGALVVLADPTPFTGLSGASDPLADYLSDSWGITVQDDIVVDLTSNQPLSAISATYSSTSPITSRTTSFTIMPEARSLQTTPESPSGVTTIPLIMTAPQSWGETDLQALQNNQELSFSESADFAGPLPLAASAENTSTHGRVVVFGDSNFARNEAFDAYANGEVFVNALDWAAEETDLINITPRTPVARTFNPPGQLAFILILLASVFVIPGLVLVAGISSWLARRRRG